MEKMRVAIFMANPKLSTTREITKESGMEEIDRIDQSNPRPLLIYVYCHQITSFLHNNRKVIKSITVSIGLKVLMLRKIKSSKRYKLVSMFVIANCCCKIDVKIQAVTQ